MARQIEYTPIDVYSDEYRKLSKEEKFKYYNKLKHTVNQRLRDIEKANVTYSPAYIAIEKSGRKTATGNVGFRNLNPNKHSLSELNKEIRAVYKALNNKTIFVSEAKKYREKQLEKLNIDISINNGKEMKRFWEIHDYFVEIGIFDKFNLGSQGKQSVVKEFIEDTEVKNYKIVGTKVKRKLDSKLTVNIVKEYKDKDIKKLKTKTDKLLTFIAKETKSIKNPETLSFNGLS